MGVRIIPEQKFAYCDRCKTEATKPWVRFRISGEDIKNTDEGGSYAKNLFTDGIELCERCMMDLQEFMKGKQC